MVMLEAKECITIAGDRYISVILMNSRFSYLLVCRVNSGFVVLETFITYRDILKKKNK